MMRNRVTFIQHRVGLNLQAGPASDVLLTWTEGDGPPAVDPVTEAVTVTNPRTQQLKLRAFVHYVQIATTEVRQYNEVEQGDCILDFADDVDIDPYPGGTKVGLKFSIDGRDWVPKKLSDGLGQTWDAFVQGKRLVRSVLLRKAT